MDRCTKNEVIRNEKKHHLCTITKCGWLVIMLVNSQIRLSWWWHEVSSFSSQVHQVLYLSRIAWRWFSIWLQSARCSIRWTHEGELYHPFLCVIHFVLMRLLFRLAWRTTKVSVLSHLMRLTTKLLIGARDFRFRWERYTWEYVYVYVYILWPCGVCRQKY